MKFSNIWKAWATTFIGALIPILTGVLTNAVNGTTDWTAVKTALIPALILGFTDALKEIENEINSPKA